jgi:hypothetical protein
MDVFDYKLIASYLYKQYGQENYRFKINDVTFSFDKEQIFIHHEVYRTSEHSEHLIKMKNETFVAKSLDYENFLKSELRDVKLNLLLNKTDEK